MSEYNNARIEHAEAIEQAVDDIVEVMTDPDSDDAPVSPETWLAAKAVILKLLAHIAGED